MRRMVTVILALGLYGCAAGEPVSAEVACAAEQQALCLRYADIGCAADCTGYAAWCETEATEFSSEGHEACLGAIEAMEICSAGTVPRECAHHGAPDRWVDTEIVGETSQAVTTVFCGGWPYTQMVVDECVNGVCRTDFIPTECTSSTSTCQYYTGACVAGKFTPRTHDDRDRYLFASRPGNPTPGQAYWKLFTGTTEANSVPVYYRQKPALIDDSITATVPVGFSGMVVEDDCLANTVEYLRAVNPYSSGSPAHWRYRLPRTCNGRVCEFFKRYSTSQQCPPDGRLQNRQALPQDRFEPNSSFGDGWILDGGPTTSDPIEIWLRPITPDPAGGTQG